MGGCECGEGYRRDLTLWHFPKDFWPFDEYILNFFPSSLSFHITILSISISNKGIFSQKQHFEKSENGFFMLTSLTVSKIFFMGAENILQKWSKRNKRASFYSSSF